MFPLLESLTTDSDDRGCCPHCVVSLDQCPKAVRPVHPHHTDHHAGVTLPLDPVFALILPVTPRFRDTCISKLS